MDHITCPRSIVLAFVLTWCSLLLAQPAVTLGDDKPTPPKPEDLTLETRDGVLLRCTYYEGLAGKKSVPIIMIHDWDGRRGEFDRIAVGLQSLGFSVIAPDLRGHGRSTRRKLPNGEDAELDRERFTKAAVLAMVNDIAAIKSFLLKKNNEGKLNIEMLCVMGSGMGALVALNYTTVDWNKPTLPAYKLGKDVRGLILISPKQSFKGLTNRIALSDPIFRAASAQSQISAMVISGKESPGHSDARRTFKSLERMHPKSPDDPKKKTLYFIELETSLAGNRLFSAPRVGGSLARSIAGFIKIRILDNADRLVWHSRENPLGGSD